MGDHSQKLHPCAACRQHTECPFSQLPVSAHITSGSRHPEPCMLYELPEPYVPPSFSPGTVFNSEKITAKHPVESILDFGSPGLQGVIFKPLGLG